MNYEYGGYGLYHEEMQRLGQLPGLPNKFKNRKLEGVKNEDDSRNPRTGGDVSVDGQGCQERVSSAKAGTPNSRKGFRQR